MYQSCGYSLAERGGFCPGAVAPIASLTLVATSAKTVHRTVFFRYPSVAPSLFESPTNITATKKERIPTDTLFFFSGGERGIRTPERVLAVTRFPVVRLRPAQPSLHIFNFAPFSVGQKRPFKRLLHYTQCLAKNQEQFSFFIPCRINRIKSAKTTFKKGE